MLLFYIRHGDPVYDPDSLTELGHKQAEALSERLAMYGLDEIYCSTSVRVQQTAAPTAQKLRLPVKLADWCSEYLAWDEFTISDERGKRWFYQDDVTRKIMVSSQAECLNDDWCKCDYFAKTAAKSGVERIRSVFCRRWATTKQRTETIMLQAIRTKNALLCLRTKVLAWLF